MSSVSEESVGITEFTSSCAGFTGILKHRYRDFQVNEISQNGLVVRLVSMEPTSVQNAPTIAPAACEKPMTGLLLKESAMSIAEQFASIAGAENAQILSSLLIAVAALTCPQASSGGAELLAVMDAAVETGGGEALIVRAAAVDTLASVSKETKHPHPSLVQGIADDRDAASVKSVMSSTAAAAAAAAAHVEPCSSEPSSAAEAALVKSIPGGGMEALLRPVESKDTRRLIHAFVKQKLPHFTSEAVCIPQTNATNELKMTGNIQQGVQIRVFWIPEETTLKGRQKAGGKKRRRDYNDDVRQPWAGGDSQYTQFVLYKENMDTQVALGLVAQHLHVSQQVFGFAGTKDKRGVTSQLMTAFKVDPVKIAALNQKLRGVRLGNFSFTSQELRLGMLAGNEFRLLMRGITSAASSSSVYSNGEKPNATELQQMVTEACSKLSSSGFINYFGLQRFGAGGVPTHVVGRTLLKREFSAALKMILSGREGEKEEVSLARAAYLKDGDAKTALKLMPMWATAERSILHVLSKKQQDGKSSGHQGEVLGAALMAVPRTLRMMYLHAYQSYLWNLAASHRVRTYGVDAVVAGDLVLVDSEQGAQSSTQDPSARSTNSVPSNDIMDPGGLTSNPSTKPDNADSGTIAAVAACVDDADAASALTSKQRLSSVHVVTPEEVEQGRWSITDVVLPVPGSKVQYPAHATAQVYAEAARQDGISLPGLHILSTDLSCTHEVLQEEGMSIAVVPLADSVVSEDKAPDEVAAANADSDPDMVSEMLRTTPPSQPLVPPAAGALPQVPKAVAAEFSFAALTGDYRHVIVKPKAFEWKLLRYSDPNDDTLVATDLEQLQASSAFSSKKVCNVDRVIASLSSDAVMSGDNKHAPRINAAALNGCRSIVDITDAENIIATTDRGLSSGLQTDSATDESAQSASALEPPRLLGLQLRFQLPSSTYATMLIRELTKESTSKDFQAALSNAGPCQKK